MSEKDVILDDFDEKDKIENEALNLWDYKIQSEIIGIVKDVSNGIYGGKKIGLLTNDTEELIFIPELTTLNTALKDVVVEDKVKIIYIGDVKSNKSNRMYANFDVYIKHQ